MQNKKNQSQKVVPPFLNRVGVWRPRRHSSTQTSLECPPPPGPYYTPLVGWSSLYLKKSFILLFLFPFKCSHWLQLNEDLEGHIDFLAQTGPFSVPIRCVTKKCQVFSCHNHHPLTTQLWYCCAIHLKVIPLFCTVHQPLWKTLQLQRWRWLSLVA